MFLPLTTYRVGGDNILLANCFLADRTPLKATSRETNLRETESNLFIVLYEKCVLRNRNFIEEFIFKETIIYLF